MRIHAATATADLQNKARVRLKFRDCEGDAHEHHIPRYQAIQNQAYNPLPK